MFRRLAAITGLILLIASAPLPGVQTTYRNPIIFGDYSDPDVVRVGNDFYLVSSSFNTVPALPILHSRDLVHWTIVGHAAPQLPSPRYDVPQHGNGIWAPSLRYHAGRYWIYVGDPDLGIFMTTATDPRGPWSPLTLIVEAKGWIDPCPLWDDDGRMYLVHAWAKSRAGFNGLLSLRRLEADGRGVVADDRTGNGRVVFDGGTAHPTIEGPKFYKRNGFYYIFAPAGGVSNGWQTVLRSKTVDGPYEDRIVMARGGSATNGPHQGGWVTTPNGESWFVHFQDRGAYGRIVHLQPMTWKNDWPVIGVDADGDGVGEPVAEYRMPTVATAPASRTADAIQTSDTFSATTLGPQWQWQANPAATWASLTARPGHLRLTPQPLAAGAANLWTAPHVLLQKLPAESFSATVTVDASGASDGDAFTLIAFGMDYAALRVTQTAQGLRAEHILCKDAIGGGAETSAATVTLPATATAHVQLRLTVTAGAIAMFSYSDDGVRYRAIGDRFTMREGRWMGAKFGIAATGSAGSRGRFDVDAVTVR